MDLAQAYRLLSAAAASGRVRAWPVALRLSRDGPEIMTALAALGGLSDADSEDEVVEAAERGERLRDIGPNFRARYEYMRERVAAAIGEL